MDRALSQRLPVARGAAVPRELLREAGRRG